MSSISFVRKPEKRCSTMRCCSEHGREKLHILNKSAAMGNYYYVSKYISLIDATLDATIQSREEYINQTIDEALAAITPAREALLRVSIWHSSQASLVGLD